ncbi:MAG TPA: hypothetical protein VK624_15510 [Steroidobacteraceae bacterium]|nr:hypothetical protein [Steroidobacteraceae bacterium]
MDRREFFTSVSAPLMMGTILAMCAVPAGAYSNPRRAARAPIRHRIRRRLLVRAVRGRLEWIVPMELAVGWELQHARRVAVVRELHIVGAEGAKSELAVVALSDGTTEKFPITRQDTSDNRLNLTGSAIEPHDHDTPAIEDLSRECARESA